MLDNKTFNDLYGFTGQQFSLVPRPSVFFSVTQMHEEKHSRPGYEATITAIIILYSSIMICITVALHDGTSMLFLIIVLEVEEDTILKKNVL